MTRPTSYVAGVNARAIKRILMRGTTRSLFGERAELAVRLPLSVVPDPFPQFEEPGERIFGFGDWFRAPAPFGGDRITRLDMVLGDPEGIPEEAIVLPGRRYGSSEWLEISVLDVPGGYDVASPPTRKDMIPVELSARTRAALAEGFLARHDWTRRWVGGMAAGPLPEDYEDANDVLVVCDRTGAPMAHKEVPDVLDALYDAAFYTKTTYGAVSDDRRFLYLIFSVKAHTPSYRLRFSSGIARATRIAKADGVALRVMPRVPRGLAYL